MFINYQHRKLREMVESSGKQVWVGITDRQTEGVFRYVNGEIVNVDRSQSFLYYFAAGEPNNHGDNEDCVHFWTDAPELNDMICSVDSFKGADFHGLCEMRKYEL